MQNSTPRRRISAGHRTPDQSASQYKDGQSASQYKDDQYKDGTNWVNGGLNESPSFFALIVAAPALSLVLSYITSEEYFDYYVDDNIDLIFRGLEITRHLLSVISPTFFAAKFVLIFFAVAFFLDVFLPGRLECGPETLTGHVPRYVDNGWRHALIFPFLFFAGSNLGSDLGGQVFNYFGGLVNVNEILDLSQSWWSPSSTYLNRLGYVNLGFDFGIFYDIFPAIVGFLNIFGLLFCLFLVVKGRSFPSTADSGTSGSLLKDFLWGTELYPRIHFNNCSLLNGFPGGESKKGSPGGESKKEGELKNGHPGARGTVAPLSSTTSSWYSSNPRDSLGWDLKRFINCRFSMTFWMLAGLSFSYRSYTHHGFIDYGLWFSALSQYLYLLKFFWWEMGYMRSIDIIVDRAGFEIQWGCLVFVPAVYTFHTRFSVLHPSGWSFLEAGLLFIVSIVAVMLNYAADNERDSFRQQFGKKSNFLIWGKKPRFIEAEYTTIDRVTGKKTKKKSLLLVSGFWGQARHFQYFFELIAAWSWCLLANPFRNGVLPLIYCVFLTFLLLHRAKRDHEKCLKKYGKYWEQYCALVPWQIVPGIY